MLPWFWSGHALVSLPRAGKLHGALRGGNGGAKTGPSAAC